MMPARCPRVLAGPCRAHLPPGHPSRGTVLSCSTSDGFIFILKDTFTFLLCLCRGMPLEPLPSSVFALGAGEEMLPVPVPEKGRWEGL